MASRIYNRISLNVRASEASSGATVPRRCVESTECE